MVASVVVAMVTCAAAAKIGGLLLAVISILSVMAIPALSLVTRTVSTEMKPDQNPRMDRNGLLNLFLANLSTSSSFSYK